MFDAYSERNVRKSHFEKGKFDHSIVVCAFNPVGDFVDYVGCIPDHNDRVIQLKTEDYCKEACLLEENFCCRSFDFNPNSVGSGTCYLSKDSSQTTTVTKPCGSGVAVLYFERIEPSWCDVLLEYCKTEKSHWHDIIAVFFNSGNIMLPKYVCLVH